MVAGQQFQARTVARMGQRERTRKVVGWLTIFCSLAAVSAGLLLLRDRNSFEQCAPLRESCVRHVLDESNALPILVLGSAGLLMIAGILLVRHQE